MKKAADVRKMKENKELSRAEIEILKIETMIERQQRNKSNFLGIQKIRIPIKEKESLTELEASGFDVELFKENVYTISWEPRK